MNGVCTLCQQQNKQFQTHQDDTEEQAKHKITLKTQNEIIRHYLPLMCELT